jgi:hypothetical protein
MKKSFAVLVLSLPILAVATTLTNKFGDGVFTTYFPGEVNETTERGTSADGKVSYTQHQFLSTTVSGDLYEGYVVGRFDYDGEITYDLDKGLSGSRDAALKEVTSEERFDSTLGGLPARYGVIVGNSKSGGKLCFYEKVARSGRRVWLVAVFANHTVPASDVSEFFNKFQLQ